MSLLPNVTYANKDTPLFLLANVSSLNVNSISTNYIQAATANVSSLNANFISTADCELSSIFATVLDLDGQVITANPTELLLNGIPIATTANISTLADWAIDPAISSINANNNDLLNTNLGYFQTVSTNNIRATNILANNILANNIFAISTYTSTISSLAEIADFGFIGNLSAGQAFIGNLSSISINTSNLNVSTLTAGIQNVSTILGNSGYYSTLFVSSINGNEFTQSSITTSSITVNVMGVSSLVATSISSIGAELRQALMSSIVFSPSLNPSLGGVNVNLGLGSLLGNVVGWGAGVFGAVTGTIGLITGAVALTQGRAGGNITNNKYELVNGTSQLQISTLGDYFSTIYRFNNSADPASIPGQEVFYSTIHAPGLAIRTLSDPLYTLSTPQSTIQAQGQWVSLGDTLDVADWAYYPALSTIQAANNDMIQVRASDISTISTTTIYGANPDVFNLFGTNPGLKIEAQNVFLSTPQVTHPGLFNGSTITVNYGSSKTAFQASTINAPVISTNTIFGTAPGGQQFLNLQSDNVTISAAQLYLGDTNLNATSLSPNTLNAQFVNVSQYISSPYIWNWGSISTTQLSTGQALLGSAQFPSATPITLATTNSAGAQSQPAGRLLLSGNDLDLQQNDLWCQQLRVGAGNPTNANSEVIFYDANGQTRAFNTGLLDRTIRVQSTINATGAGYLLDTLLNPPFFSTINNQVNLMSFFPSTANSTIGISTISKMNPVNLYGRSTLAGGTLTVVFSPPFANSNEYSVQLTYKDTAAGAALHANILSISSFSANGGGTQDFFWSAIGRV